MNPLLKKLGAKLRQMMAEDWRDEDERVTLGMAGYWLEKLAEESTKKCEPTCSRLFLIRGVPGSGKTTYAKTLGIADHYEADMWFDANGGYNPSKIKLAHEWCQKQAISAMRAGRDVVVSNTFTRLWEMQPYKDEAKKLGVEVVEKVMYGEWKNVHGVPDEKVRQMRERFEYANH